MFLPYKKFGKVPFNTRHIILKVWRYIDNIAVSHDPFCQAFYRQAGDPETTGNQLKYVQVTANSLDLH